MIKIPHFQCRRHRFNPGRGTEIPQAAWHGQKKINKVKILKCNLFSIFFFFVENLDYYVVLYRKTACLVW